MNPNEIRDREAEAYATKTCRTYVDGSDLPSRERAIVDPDERDAFRSGWDAALAKDPRVVELKKIVYEFLHHWELGTYVDKRLEDALAAFEGGGG